MNKVIKTELGSVEYDPELHAVIERLRTNTVVHHINTVEHLILTNIHDVELLRLFETVSSEINRRGLNASL